MRYPNLSLLPGHQACSSEGLGNCLSIFFSIDEENISKTGRLLPLIQEALICAKENKCKTVFVTNLKHSGTDAFSAMKKAFRFLDDFFFAKFYLWFGSNCYMEGDEKGQ